MRYVTAIIFAFLLMSCTSMQNKKQDDETFVEIDGIDGYSLYVVTVDEFYQFPMLIRTDDFEGAIAWQNAVRVSEKINIDPSVYIQFSETNKEASQQVDVDGDGIIDLIMTQPADMRGAAILGDKGNTERFRAYLLANDVGLDFFNCRTRGKSKAEERSCIEDIIQNTQAGGSRFSTTMSLNRPSTSGRNDQICDIRDEIDALVINDPPSGSQSSGGSSGGRGSSNGSGSPSSNSQSGGSSSQNKTPPPDGPNCDATCDEQRRAARAEGLRAVANAGYNEARARDVGNDDAAAAWAIARVFSQDYVQTLSDEHATQEEIDTAYDFAVETFKDAQRASGMSKSPSLAGNPFTIQATNPTPKSVAGSLTVGRCGSFRDSANGLETLEEFVETFRVRPLCSRGQNCRVSDNVIESISRRCRIGDIGPDDRAIVFCPPLGEDDANTWSNAVRCLTEATENETQRCQSLQSLRVPLDALTTSPLQKMVGEGCRDEICNPG